MVSSMTGFGNTAITVKGTNIVVEVRSVNHRFLDISTKIPRSLLVLEDKLKRIVQTFFHRGRVDIYITIEGSGFIEHTVDLNWDLANQYISKLQEVKDRFQLGGEITLEMLAKFEDVFSVKELEQQPDELKEGIMEALTEACQKVQEMRQKEGKKLIDDLVDRVKLVENTVNKLGERRDIVIIEYRDRIKARIEEYINQLDGFQTNVYQDIAILAEKGDITEEVTRLRSHVNQFLKTISQKGAIGRKLDFILQEMHRETNTIGSKSNDVKISELVVVLKSEIEKIKEQIQNVE
ncbi:YicC/YloC family endoribonuclease [Aquibacillus kalidii]|uniref:YicC/YloC family endoribonuclease n=1 Tax=Aquibacillus kalidii TaxID=2762597 RepID=UPI001648C7D3|nr:YicC/YloC family endoribonuclease [Aquibacillus kalidii]